MTAEEKQNLITEIDVTYGDGNPWFGFEKLSPATTERQEGLRENVWLTYRKGVKGMYLVNVDCSSFTDFTSHSRPSRPAVALLSGWSIQDHASRRSSRMF